jgi:hypothetical protein
MSPRDADHPRGPRSGIGSEGAPEPDALPTGAELAAAALLRRALERPSGSQEGDADRELAEAIRAAALPGPLSEDRLREIVDAALSKKPRGRVIYVAFGGTIGLAAMAAGLALVVRGPASEAPSSLSQLPSPVAISRSTTSLFPDGIPATGGTSSRVDRIAYARARDLRENQFVRWGVR